MKRIENKSSPSSSILTMVLQQLPPRNPQKKFVDTHHLKTSTTPPVALHLFDGSSNNTISEIANLFIIFSTGDCMNLDFYVTLLNSSYSLVLGYNWLA